MASRCLPAFFASLLLALVAPPAGAQSLVLRMSPPPSQEPALPAAAAPAPSQPPSSQCPSHCVSCATPDTCDICEVGYEKDVLGMCQQPIENLRPLPSSSPARGPAPAGAAAPLPAQAPSSQCPLHCVSCTTAETCDICEAGYVKDALHVCKRPTANSHEKALTALLVTMVGVAAVLLHCGSGILFCFALADVSCTESCFGFCSQAKRAARVASRCLPALLALLLLARAAPPEGAQSLVLWMSPSIAPAQPKVGAAAPPPAQPPSPSCPSHCASCSTLDTCDVCEVGYAVDALGLCQQPIGSPGPSLSPVPPQWPAAPPPAQPPSSRCPSHCASCTTADTCDICETGYVEDALHSCKRPTANSHEVFQTAVLVTMVGVAAVMLHCGSGILFYFALADVSCTDICCDFRGWLCRPWAASVEASAAAAKCVGPGDEGGRAAEVGPQVPQLWGAMSV